MSMLDKLKSMLKGHEEQAGKGVDKAGDYANEKTQGKYSGQIDKGRQRLKDEFGGGDKGQPPQS
ncbi:antitoxin [Streptomyces sp. BBFR2]|uniref:antitoxin n=1 Tax=Streptomyces sp. BBFR2 TaxID=3372854 RepID=UPI0037D9CFAE